MLLGTIFKELDDEAFAARTLLALGDMKLMVMVDAARGPHEETVGEYVSGAARRFASFAGDEDWLRVMTAIERSQHPAGACLTEMLKWSIERDRQSEDGAHTSSACTCGGGNGGCHDH